MLQVLPAHVGEFTVHAPVDKILEIALAADVPRLTPDRFRLLPVQACYRIIRIQEEELGPFAFGLAFLFTLFVPIDDVTEEEMEAEEQSA